MSHTIRAYNKRPLIGGPGFKGWISSRKLRSEDLKDPLQHQGLSPTWTGYHPYAAWGRMRGWKDWRLRVRRRQARKSETKRVSESEGFSDAWDWFNEVKRSCQHIPDIWEDLDEGPHAEMRFMELEVEHA